MISVVIGKSTYGVRLPNRSIFAADKVITIILIVQHPKVNRALLHNDSPLHWWRDNPDPTNFYRIFSTERMEGYQHHLLLNS